MNAHGLWLRVAGLAALATALASLLAGLIAFVCVAGYLALQDTMSSGAAFSIVALSAVAALTLLVFAGRHMVTHMLHRSATARARSPETLAVDLALEVLTAMQKHPFHASAISLGAGFVVGAVPGLRRTLLHALLKG